MVVQMVNACTSGQLRAADCGPVWHLGIIATLVVTLVVALLVMRLRARLRSSQA